MMKDIIEKLRDLQETDYVRFRPAITKAELEKLNSATLRIMPSEYLEFVSISNGIYATEWSDCKIYDAIGVQELLDVSREYHGITDMLTIGIFWGDQLYVNRDNRVYISLECISEPRALNISFKDFLQKCIDTHFGIFWDEE